ncbi:glycoside hydrolase family 36 protein [Pedobacter borealis]|uniref:glycoside hydrolase family 36 protein n=1 Tax=Pedobacter borealis TaxID=475254 RepID=UPI00068BB2D8|nr:glycoside hydrolase family 36 protein [Pedobacter borealis]
MKKYLVSLMLFTALGVISLSCSVDNSGSADGFVQRLKDAPAKVILTDGAAADALIVGRKWSSDLCALSVKNTSAKAVQVKEVVVFDLQHQLADTTKIYGEAFQKLGQIGGTLGKPEDWGTYPDRSHYKIPEPENLRTAYGMLTLQLPENSRVLLATTSCKRFISRFSFDAKRLRISLDCENLVLQPGETWSLEEFLVTTSNDREKNYDRLTEAISKHHPRLKHDPVPMGWCSWYCFGPAVTAKNVSDNTNWIAKNLPQLKYIQIDDGYQPWMGDWLEKGKAFGGDVAQVLHDIKNKGLEPAIWVAPFVASPQSELFKNHPDWFVKDEAGKPLRSDKIGFGGWRLGPWYVLDGTHPAVQQYYTELFKTMRQKWGVTYFKLDANYWGAMYGGVHYDKKATRIEAYRRGMEAILKGSGDAFILGCNHPIWGSLGLIHGSRSSMDTWRDWKSFRNIGRENLLRGWQNGRLWWNDPDCILLTDNGAEDVMDQGGNAAATKKVVMPENEFLYHATTVYASGGMLLSGDDLTTIKPERLAILKKMIPPTGKSARFENEKFEVGIINFKDHIEYTVFNASDAPVSRKIKLPAGKYTLSNKWTGKEIGVFEKEYVINDLLPHSAQLIVAKKVN